jgi:hypothetical protein
MSISGICLLLLQVQLGSVSGIVNKSGGNEPLPGATVILNPVLSTQSVRFTTSEDDGRFTIRDIEPGEYRLQVQSPLYGGVAYGQRRPGGPGTILTIVSGKEAADLKVSMVPTGAIAGRITGRSGEPLAYATVQALKYVYQDGRRILAAAQSTLTDDRGNYRLFWLTNGKYVVIAAPRNSAGPPPPSHPPIRPGDVTRTTGDILLAPGPLAIALFDTMTAGLDGTNLVKRLLDDGSVQEESWMPTFYPGTPDRGLAIPLDVTAGSTVTGIDISLGPSPVQKIGGRVTGFTSRTTVGLASVSQGTIGRLINKGVSLVDGSFEFPGVVPGPYYLTAQDQAGRLATPMAVLVADRDVENLSLPLAPAITVTAQITADDPMIGLAGTLRPDLDATEGALRLNLGLRSVPVSPGNVMVFTNMAPGNYQLTLQHLANPASPKRFYIKSIRQGREDAFGTVRLSADTRDVLLEVVLTTETGSVEGVAIGRTGDPAANVTVVLVPANARKRTNLYQTLVTGRDGKFRFQEVPPGDYKLFSWEDIETGAWQDEEFVRPFESRGRAVRVSENSKEDVQLNVIQNP